MYGSSSSANPGMGMFVLVLELAGKSAAQYRLGSRSSDNWKNSKSPTRKTDNNPKKTIGKGILPAVFIQFSVFNRSDWIFPLICAEAAPHDAGRREAKNARFQIVQCLCQIFLNPFLRPFHVSTEKWDMLQIIFLKSEISEVWFGIIAVWFQYQFILFPVAAVYIQFREVMMLCFSFNNKFYANTCIFITHSFGPQ